METNSTTHFKNIDYGEIFDYEEKEKDPILFAGHFRCTTDWENKTYVRDKHGELIPWKVAEEAMPLQDCNAMTNMRREQDCSAT